MSKYVNNFWRSGVLIFGASIFGLPVFVVPVFRVQVFRSLSLALVFDYAFFSVYTKNVFTFFWIFIHRELKKVHIANSRRYVYTAFFKALRTHRRITKTNVQNASIFLKRRELSRRLDFPCFVCVQLCTRGKLQDFLIKPETQNIGILIF